MPQPKQQKSNSKAPVIKAYLINIFGKRGSGKTTLLKGQLDSFPGPVVVLDILGNFNSEEYIQLDSISETISNMKYYVNNYKKQDLQKVIVLKPAEPTVAIDFISAAMWELKGGTLVIDETDAFSLTDSTCFDQLIRYGRNHYVNIVTGCRRPYEISRSITAGANKMFLFQTQEPRDIEYFKSTVLGEKAYKLKELPQFHGIYVDYDDKITGEFKIDLDGKIYKLTEEPLK